MKKITFLVLFISFLLSTNLKSQDYDTGIGIRSGLSNGATIKHFLGEETAVEGILSLRWGGINVTGLYEIHNNAFDVERLNWYYGFGGHIGFWDGNVNPWFKDNNSYTVIGIDGIIGIEYNFSEIPINISIDWKPALNLIGYTGFWGDEGAVSVRYIF
ncbi:MAG: hypothetical protein KAT68_14280 [Bacteroidales bacterium]|nr:hypothetical protein [Bacteroidales bacterium]